MLIVIWITFGASLLLLLGTPTPVIAGVLDGNRVITPMVFRVMLSVIAFLVAFAASLQAVRKLNERG